MLPEEKFQTQKVLIYNNNRAYFAHSLIPGVDSQAAVLCQHSLDIIHWLTSLWGLEDILKGLQVNTKVFFLELVVWPKSFLKKQTNKKKAFLYYILLHHSLLQFQKATFTNQHLSISPVNFMEEAKHSNVHPVQDSELQGQRQQRVGKNSEILG